MDPHVYIRERADELAVAEQKSLAREPITLGPGNQGDRKKFMQALYGKGGIAEEKAALVAKYEEELDTHEERMLGQFMVEKWVEATWIARLQQFPDGRPYNRQTRLNLTIWGVFLRPSKHAGGGYVRQRRMATQARQGRSPRNGRVGWQSAGLKSCSTRNQIARVDVPDEIVVPIKLNITNRTCSRRCGAGGGGRRNW